MSIDIKYANIVGMKKRIVFAVLMTALIVINVFCSFENQKPSEPPAGTAIVAAEPEKVNIEETTAANKITAETTTAEKITAESETTAAAPKKEKASEKFSEAAVDDEKTVSPVRDVQNEERKPTPKKITVTVSINCENAVNYGFDIAPYLLSNESYTAKEGTTAFDALKALCDENGISLKYQRKTYIQGIGGLNEKDCGGSSGWMYLVNGEKISKPASSYTLKNGDVVEWRYVTNANE